MNLEKFATITINAHGVIIGCDDEISKLVGWRCSELRFQPLTSIIADDDDRNAHQSHLDLYINAGRQRRHLRSVRALHRDGSVVPVDIMILPAMSYAGHTTITAVLALAQKGDDERIDNISVLALWPGNPDLDIDSSSRALYDSGVSYDAMVGDRVTRRRVRREIRNESVNILEIGSHGEEKGIALADGIAEPGWWARAVADAGIQVALLLACDSDEVGYAIKRAGVPHVIAARGEIPDQSAIEFAKSFYECLAEGEDILSALDEARMSLSREDAEKFVVL